MTSQQPVRVLHILHSMNRGGAENALMNYYRNIDRNKVQFDFLLTTQEACDFEDEIIELGGRIFRIPLLTIKNPFKYIRAIDKFLKSHAEYKIVHSHTNSKSVVPLYIAKRRHVPIRISHSHNGKSEPGLSGRIRNVLMPFIKYTANIYFSCGEQASNWLYREKFYKNKKVEIVNNVINAEWFRYNEETRRRLRSELHCDDDTIVIGQVARLCWVKNHKFSLEILKETIKLHPNTILIIIGDGPLKQEIIDYAKELGISENIKMLGVLENVYDYEQTMDAFLLPSFYEGLPLSIIEAQISGLSCFVTKGRVSPECSVTDLVTYLPIENGAKIWAEEIIKATSKPRKDRFEEIKAAGYDAKTSAEKLQNRYLELYDAIQS